MLGNILKLMVLTVSNLFAKFDLFRHGHGCSESRDLSRDLELESFSELSVFIVSLQ